MSDLRPKGTPLSIGGEEHSLLFNLNAVDEIQDRMDMPIDDVIDLLSNPRTAWKACRVILCCLLNDEEERKQYSGAAGEIRNYTEKEIGWMVTEADKYEVVAAIVRAYGADVPEPEDEDPNAESVQQPERN